MDCFKDVQHESPFHLDGFRLPSSRPVFCRTFPAGEKNPKREYSVLPFSDFRRSYSDASHRSMTTIVALSIQAILVLILSPLSIGLVRWFKARLQGRRGAPPWLVYTALLTTLKKQNVMSESASWIFRFVPSVFLVFALPLLFLNGGLPQIDLFVLAGVLSLGFVFLVLGGLDAATAFGGM